jgi:hypothetical protein
MNNIDFRTVKIITMATHWQILSKTCIYLGHGENGRRTDTPIYWNPMWDQYDAITEFVNEK